MNEFILPELYCPFPSRINKYADVLEDYSLEWVLRFNLLANESSYQRFCKTKFFSLAASVYPHYQIEELKIGSDWLSWLFIWDDQCDLSDLRKKPEALKVFHNRFMEIFKGAKLTTDDIPISRALSDLRQRMLEIWGAKYIHLLVPCLQDYFNGCELQASNHLHSQIPDLETYIKTRRQSVAGDLVLAWIDYFNQLMIPDVLRNHKIVKEINQVTIDILAWCNDIVSFSKELKSDDIHNLVLLWQYEHKSTLEEAIMRVAIMHDQQVQTLISLEKFIPSFGEEIDAEINRYISGIHEWIRGNYDWHYHSPRYHSAENLDLVRC